jgi:hypothetical protein
MRIVLLTAALAVLAPQGAPLLAQGVGTIVGTVVDETSGEPLEGATISFVDQGVEASTDANGVFQLPSVRAGDLAARVESSGYVTLVEQVEVLADEVGLLRFRLSRVAAALQGLVVRARRQDNQGASVAEAKPGDLFVQSALDLLREQMPGVVVRTSLGAETGIRIRGSNSFLNNDPAIYVDGIRIGDSGSVSALHALEQIPAERVARIRVLRGPSAAARYADANNGVILVETR